MSAEEQPVDVAESGGGGAGSGGPKWIEIQTHTFKNWVNEQLKKRDMSISDLGTDLSDGIHLIHLIEVAAGGDKSVGKYNKIIKLPTHKLENTQIAMNFLVREGVKVVNIGNEDIGEKNARLFPPSSLPSSNSLYSRI